jgi:hypothetical protein
LPNARNARSDDGVGAVSDLTADELESLVREAHQLGDAEGVQSALVALAMLDPARAAELLDALKLDLNLDLGITAD